MIWLFNQGLFHDLELFQVPIKEDPCCDTLFSGWPRQRFKVRLVRRAILSQSYWSCVSEAIHLYMSCDINREMKSPEN